MDHNPVIDMNSELNSICLNNFTTVIIIVFTISPVPTTKKTDTNDTLPSFLDIIILTRNGHLLKKQH